MDHSFRHWQRDLLIAALLVAMPQAGEARLPIQKVAAQPIQPNLSPKAVFDREQAMTPSRRIGQWKPLVDKASRRVGVPVAWINAVMRVESGGRTMLSGTQRMVSAKGALGLMQVLPETYGEMRGQYRLGADPFEPEDNIQAGAAYLRWLRGKYGYPAMFAAYNAGPERVDDLLTTGKALPAETQAYVARVGAILDGHGGPDGASINAARFTRPDGSIVLIDPMAVTAVRAVLEGEYAAEVHAVLQMGRLTQGIREVPQFAISAIRIRGGKV
jgi:soluble lytic murein transglycosylase-like protein